jgi:DNA-binding SARP family transcriptional activator
MSLQTISDELYQAFVQKGEHARIVLLHSHGHYRSLLMSRLLSSPDFHTVYYAMGPDDVDTVAFLSGFTHDLAEQYPTFGTHVNQVGFDTSDEEALVMALAQDLNELDHEPYLLILDEFDQAEIADDLQHFLEHLVNYLPAQCRLVLSGRKLPRLPWVSLIAQNKAIMLRDAELVSRDFYQESAGQESRVQVYGLGPGHVLLDGQPIDSWEGHLPRLLFFFSLDRPMVTRSEICQAFWPDLDTDQAVNVFHVTKRRLHKALEVLGVDILIHDGGYYRVNPILNVRYDVIDFVSALVEGRSAHGKSRLTAWQRAIDLYQRPFLQGHHEQWVLKRREEYQTGYIEALTAIAHIRAEDGRPEQALALLTRAVTDDPRRQDIHREVMRLYAELGRRSEAAGHFQKLQDQLNERGIEVDPETHRLYNDLMS